MKRHVNIPIFIPHEGCRNTCIFCNQKKITGSDECANRDIIPEIDRALATISPDQTVQIAFFGGSFTGIDRKTLERLLSDANRYITNGKVASIRVSTRPDYIDDEVLELLWQYGVRDIELGVQSMSEKVLSAAKRGHTVKDTEAACEKIVSRGFSLTGQMMIGLPLSTPKKELTTAKRMKEMGVTSARIYPTVVFHKTALLEMAERGEYKPLSVEEAVLRCAAVYEYFLQNDICVLRVGLQSSAAFSEDETVYAGANHAALGELVENELYLTRLAKSFDKLTYDQNDSHHLRILCPVGETSKVAGHNCRNKDKIFTLFEKKGIMIKTIKITESDTLRRFEVQTELTGANTKHKRG